MHKYIEAMEVQKHVDQSAQRGHILLTKSRTWKLHLHYGDFVQPKFNMVNKTAGELESALRVKKASVKTFKPRIS